MVVRSSVPSIGYISCRLLGAVSFIDFGYAYSFGNWTCETTYILTFGVLELFMRRFVITIPAMNKEIVNIHRSHPSTC